MANDKNSPDELDILATASVPRPDVASRDRAMRAALAAFDENISAAPQGTATAKRPNAKAITLWSWIMDRRFLTAPAFAGLVALPIAGYAAFYLMDTSPFAIDRERNATVNGGKAEQPRPKVEQPRPEAAGASTAQSSKDEAQVLQDAESRRDGQVIAPELAREQQAEQEADSAAPPAAAPAPAQQTLAGNRAARAPSDAASRTMAPPLTAVLPMPEPMPQLEQSRDRVAEFDTNPVRSALESPVSTFSIDADTASYSFVRRSLKEGVLPQADTVRVEEMVNYFPYGWQGPDSAETPFRANVAVMPTPWNAGTKLMHVAIKGYDVQAATKPKANLVFLIDVSGSMDEPDKLPLLKASFRMLVNQIGAEDMVSIVTYAGNAGTVLEPTKGSEKQKILDAIDRLEPGGSTAGEAGIKQAYRLAQSSFVEGGVNRVMLATDGDFNVGQTDDDDLKRLIEEKRQSGVFLSVFGFGRGNLNDQMMQTIAQNGNGTAAYIDTLAEAEKTLVEEASSTLFPIAKDVKIQVEFNPAAISEYRLVGYETRALNREDFNNDRVDAGEVGSGHSVTAIYEITPKGSPAQTMDDLRYGEAQTNNAGGIANAGEYAFVKIRYKLPDEDVSKLIETPVTTANEVGSFDAASDDQRFSVAVAAFGQKLRKTTQTAGMGYNAITAVASAARGDDPFGYRTEFLSLVRLAAALDGSGNR